MRTALLDPLVCYRAILARDRRFDGHFFVGVSTTGIYCRPICSARTPRRDRCAFFRTPAEAERAGFRACFRCRPELAPGLAPLDSIPRLVAEAARRIDEGFLNDRSVDALAAELGVTSRHLRRAMEAFLGVTPIELAQTRRLALAKQLLHDSHASLTQIALGSGFRSVRRFNSLFRERFGRAPSAMRRDHGATIASRGPELVLRLGYRPPLDWDGLLGFLRGRAVPGVEHVANGIYRRTVAVDDDVGTLAVANDRDRAAIVVTVSPRLAGALMPITARLKSLFDLDANPHTIGQVLSRDARLAPLVSRRPGLRVPGAFDAFEAAVRAILGQQVTVRAATTLAGRLVARFGRPLAADAVTESRAELTHLFPDASRLAAARVGDIASLGIVSARARAIVALAAAVADGSLRLDRHAPVDQTMRRLEELPGVGPWTAHYVAMRALRHPDAFPAADIAIRKALGGLGAREAAAQSEAWRPWRSYAVLHLWASLGDDPSP
ncbi:MAG: AlkA N-terminal domain-containing protein [bacterium]